MCIYVRVCVNVCVHVCVCLWMCVSECVCMCVWNISYKEPETLLWDHKLSWHVILILLTVTVSYFQTVLPVPLPKHGFRQLAFSAIIFFNGAVQARKCMVLLCEMTLSWELRWKGEHGLHMSFLSIGRSGKGSRNDVARSWASLFTGRL